MNHKRSSFSGQLGYVLAAAGASVGLGNIWRFPYLAAKYGGGIFLLIYIIFSVTFGYTMIVAETVIGRKSRRSPVGAFASLGGTKVSRVGGWLNAVVPMLIVPYYCVIGGWIVKYLVSYLTGHGNDLAGDAFFGGFIGDGLSVEIWFLLFTLVTVSVIYRGVQKGIERVSRVMMPILIVLAIFIVIYSVSRPGALGGVVYFLIPNPANFSYMTIIGAMEQMFYSLSIAMGILVTFGSYMKKETAIETATKQVTFTDTGVAMLSALMIIPAVFAYSGGSAESLKQGPSLMFVTMPKIFASLGLFGTIVGALFFLLVAFAAMTSSIALAESAVSTFQDEMHWGRKKATTVVAAMMLGLGSLSALGYGPLANVKPFGLQFLDFFDFLTNSLMMPIAALCTCILVCRHVGLDAVEEEMTEGGAPFKRKKIFAFVIRFLGPLFAICILVSSVLKMLGLVTF